MAIRRAYQEGALIFLFRAYEVQGRLGHTDVQTTMNIYAHVTQKAKEEAIQKFEKYLNI